MAIKFCPLRKHLQTNGISYYYLESNGIDSQTCQRLKKDKNINMKTLNRLCNILDLPPEKIIVYVPDEEPNGMIIKKPSLCGMAF